MDNEIETPQKDEMKLAPPPVSKRSWEERLALAENAAEDHVKNLIADVPEESAAAIQPLTELLQDLRDRRDKLQIKPEFTVEIVGICKQILAFGAAGLGLTVASWDKIRLLSPAWRVLLELGALFYINLTITSLIVLVWFCFQARTRYPFLYLEKLGNAFPYFYYETLNRDRRWRPLSSKAGIVEDNIAYLKDLERFAERMTKETLRDRVRAELQQYYLLIVYQGYLDQYELQLTHLLLYCVVGGTIASIAAITVQQLI